MDDEKVVQIIEATNWYAVYWEEEPPHYSKYPLACWALTSDGRVMGLDAEGVFVHECSEARNFGGYVFGPSASPEQKADYEGQSKAWYAKENKAK